MAFNDDLFHARASKGDVGLLAIRMAATLHLIQRGLRKLKEGDRDSLDEIISDIGEYADKLDEQFKSLTGYTDGE